tara:strand:- start:998 stop:1216 length:219 start_codon:yes stop_codon:yes gene_type:complete
MQGLHLELPVTDISSIMLSDEGDILSDNEGPDLDYNRLIRPCKSGMGSFCIKKHVILGVTLIALAALAIISK